MNVRIVRAGVPALAAALVLAAGCSGQPARQLPDAIAEDAPAKAMELYDTNKDGYLDATELKEVPGLRAALNQVDTNHDGKLSADEIAARIQSWKDSKWGRSVINVTVRHKGAPLAGAKVVFEPESFLGSGLRGGEGVTDAKGRATISAPLENPNDLPGLSPGFYRVRITKEGEPISAEYNTKTTLGQEVAPDAQGMMRGIVFDLKY